MHLLIVENEPLVAEDIVGKLQLLGYSSYDIVDSFDSSLESIEKKTPALVFIDIEINGNKDGIELGKVLAQKKIPFIYLSNLQDMLTFERASKTNPQSNIPKPINLLQLRNAILEVNFDKSKQRKQKNYLVVPHNTKRYKIDKKAIIFLKAARNNCEIHIQGEEKKRYVSSIPMGAVIKAIGTSNFIQVHRSYAINIDKINSFEGNMIFMNDKNRTEIPIGEKFRSDFKLNFDSV